MFDPRFWWCNFLTEMEGCAMGQVLHGCATTTEAIRRAIQHSQESLRGLARRYGINPKTVAKWKKRASVADLPTGPKEAKSTALGRGRGDRRHLTQAHAAAAWWLSVYLAGDDPAPGKVVAAPLPATPRNLPAAGGRRRQGRPAQVQNLSDWLLLYIDIAEVRTAEGRLYLFVAIDRTSKFAFTELYAKATTRVAADFLRALIQAVPYKIHTVLTDNGIHFNDPSGESWSPAEIKEMIERKEPFRAHAFELACARNDIDHRLTKPMHPWTNGQVERMNRTIKEATVKRFYYETHDQLQSHLADFVAA
jgi:transposase InsO family protein